MQSIALTSLHLSADQTGDVEYAATLLKQGHLVGVATETVYGLAADATNAAAVRSIFEAKNRPITHPLIVHVASIRQLSFWVKSIPEWVEKLIRLYSPGPLTVILPKADHVLDEITGGLDTVAVRIPDLLSTRALIELVGFGIAAPSANRHQYISSTTAEHVLQCFDGEIAAVLDAGPCAKGLESTILDCTQYPPVLCRPGPISPEDIRSAIGVAPMQLVSNQPVPGNMRVHYSPRTKTRLIASNDIKNNMPACDSILICYSADLNTRHFKKTIALPIQKEGYAKGLYAALREADTMDCSGIFIETPPQTPEWDDVNDRLKKACARG